MVMKGKFLSLPIVLILADCFIQHSDSYVVFNESFHKPFQGRWIVSEKDEYEGVWKHAKSEGHDDYGLLVSKKAKKYAIVRELNEPFDPNGRTTVLQFEIRLQKGLECGGAYLKYLPPQKDGWKPHEFDNKSPYSIMFGPDKCDSTDKVHFVLKHKNPKSGEYVEHHLKSPPAVPSDKLSHVYTAILKPDSDLVILIDGKPKKRVNFLIGDDFEPPIILAKTIPDPGYKKPEIWDEMAETTDPEAVKPTDSDENAWEEIKDEEFMKPKWWLNDDLKKIDYGDAIKEDVWDDKENGECEVPDAENPMLESALGQCKWKNPMKIRNSAFKGKQHVLLIDNPKYKSISKSNEIPNPDYYELDKPEFELVAAIGIEIWTMTDGILFDNILIATSEEDAETYMNETWKPKSEAEKEFENANEATDQCVSEETLLYLLNKILDLLYTCKFKFDVTRGNQAIALSLSIFCCDFCHLSLNYEV